MAQNSWEKFVKNTTNQHQMYFSFLNAAILFFVVWQSSSPNREITDFSSNTILVETFSVSFPAFPINYCTILYFNSHMFNAQKILF